MGRKSQEKMTGYTSDERVERYAIEALIINLNIVAVNQTVRKLLKNAS